MNRWHTTGPVDALVICIWPLLELLLNSNAHLLFHRVAMYAPKVRCLHSSSLCHDYRAACFCTIVKSKGCTDVEKIESRKSVQQAATTGSQKMLQALYERKCLQLGSGPSVIVCFACLTVSVTLQGHSVSSPPGENRRRVFIANTLRSLPQCSWTL
jgi:hypothetical protein